MWFGLGLAVHPFLGSPQTKEKGVPLRLKLGNGSLDYNFLGEIKLGFPLNPPKSEELFAGGSLQQPRKGQPVFDRRRSGKLVRGPCPLPPSTPSAPAVWPSTRPPGMGNPISARGVCQWWKLGATFFAGRPSFLLAHLDQHTGPKEFALW